jgi:hypothetical protein
MENDNNNCEDCAWADNFYDLQNRVEKVLDLCQAAELLDDRYSDNRIRRNALREVVKLLKEPE